MNLQKDTMDLIKKHGLWAKKSLGQNFLISEKALNKIVTAAELTKKDFVLEIGPGTGTLTRELVKHAGEVLSIEKDDQLKEILSPYNVRYEDALNIDPRELPTPYKLVANIPYYITSPIVNHFLKEQFIINGNPASMVVLLMQREVAEKIVSQKRNSVLSMSTKVFGEPEIISHVPATAFFPVPKVESSILRIKVHEKPLVSCDLNKFFRIIHTGFSNPRKKLSNNLKPLEISQEKTDIDLNRRAETLEMQEWEQLAKLVE